ncbi:hypothetical protein LMG28727_02732 [Paraburkholderia kirstenboschensis]|nr:hypothetical protein LMG28727_02732 [Paraburkholderia kirstenboschensis]
MRHGRAGQPGSPQRSRSALAAPPTLRLSRAFCSLGAVRGALYSPKTAPVRPFPASAEPRSYSLPEALFCPVLPVRQP